jgi:hypothetical protein
MDHREEYTGFVASSHYPSRPGVGVTPDRILDTKR